jgi:nucleoside 2-deoxyribosyltransferase
MKIYYAHPLTMYGSEREKKDLLLLAQLGFEVYNPNQEAVTKQYLAARARQEQNEAFDAFAHVFKPLVLACDGVAFRAFGDGRVGAGVATECNWAVVDGRPVFELPTYVRTRFLTVSETRARIRKMTTEPDWTEWHGMDPRDPNH